MSSFCRLGSLLFFSVEVESEELVCYLCCVLAMFRCVHIGLIRSSAAIVR